MLHEELKRTLLARENCEDSTGDWQNQIIVQSDLGWFDVHTVYVRPDPRTGERSIVLDCREQT